MFVRLFVDENLDRHVPISKQPKEMIRAIVVLLRPCQVVNLSSKLLSSENTHGWKSHLMMPGDNQLLHQNISSLSHLLISQAIIDSCTRQFPEYSERARKRIRTYLKSCRRFGYDDDDLIWTECAKESVT